ncbi:hypothetical protein [Companilactobacillus sp. HBUAS56275]|uniref:SHOCT domain-containing protein n=1 Tax=Candidatus Companilactobacillus pullicola TaxID=2838523 RepID=A0A9D1ZL77_9LACO|nr:hypothetical protein [Candidatus Companilactobacillus pullicola]
MMGLSGCHFFGGMGFMGGGFLFYGIIILLIIIAAVYLFSRQNGHKQNSALEVLDREYAQGKVSDADYEKRKENLTK